MTTTTPSTASVSTESPSRSSHKAYTFLWFAVSAATGALIMTEQWTQYGMYFVSALYLATVTPGPGPPYHPHHRHRPSGEHGNHRCNLGSV